MDLRSKHFICFVDLKKAFDKVNRQTPLNVLIQKKFNASLVRAIHGLLSNTSATINGEKVDTEIGVPQGAVTSPILFNLYI